MPRARGGLGAPVKKADREKFLRLLDEEEPDDVWPSPDCRLWSQWQEMNARTPEKQEKLKHDRSEHHDVHLEFCREIYHRQVHGGRHAHAEQPAHAKSWSTRAMRQMRGHRQHQIVVVSIHDVDLHPGAPP